jgi:hypothetical protein
MVDPTRLPVGERVAVYGWVACQYRKGVQGAFRPAPHTVTSPTPIPSPKPASIRLACACARAQEDLGES